MGFTEKTNYLLETKSLLKDRINSLGGSITSGTTFRDYLVWLDSLYEALDEKTITGLPESLEGKCEQDGTPTPSSPIPINITTGRQVVSVCGKNLFDKDKCVLGKVWNGSNNTKRAYGYIEAVQGQQYTISCNNSNSDLTIYVVETTTIGVAGTNIRQVTLTNSTPQTFTPRTNTKYIAIQFATTTNNTTQEMIDNAYVMLEKGDQATTYEEYKGNDYEINLGKNLFKFDDISGTKNGLTYSVSNGEISISGTSTYSSAFGVFGESSSSKLPILEKGETYTLSTTTPLTGLYLQINYYKEGSTTQYSLVSQVTSSTTFTTPNDFDRIAQIFVGSLANFSGNYTFNIQLEKGSKSSYSPYKTPIYLGKIGTYQDYIFRNTTENPLYDSNLEEGQWYIHKEIGRYVFTGNENFGTTNDVFYLVSGLDYATSNNIPVCTCLKGVNNVTTGNTYVLSNNQLAFRNSKDYDRLYLRADGYTTTTIKSALSGAVLYYVLNTPTNTLIEDEELINQLNEIDIFTVISEDFYN